MAYAAQQPPERRTNYTPRDFTEAYTYVCRCLMRIGGWGRGEEREGGEGNVAHIF